MKKFFLPALWVLFYLPGCKQSQPCDYPYHEVPFTCVTLKDNFWMPRVETCCRITLPHIFEQCRQTGRIDNFLIAAGKKTAPLTSFGFDDSDVYKMIEGAARCLALSRDTVLERAIDSLIDVVVAAQEEDGYLYTHGRATGMKRWKGERTGSHETYNLGHLMEAAVAYYQVTGKRKLLNAALKSADLLYTALGPGKADTIVPGHQEVEIGLIKLYRVTGQKKYLELARCLLDRRGTSSYAYAHEWESPVNHQDDRPVRQQYEAYGHAVRALYMYMAMTDVVALSKDTSYLSVLHRIWNNIVSSKVYITGGTGSSSAGEAFGAPYELPNATAYNETCAAIAFVMWNYRMFLLHGETKYMDVLEQTLYNSLLAGYAMNGKAFFYPNPLASDGVTPFNHGDCKRQSWFTCACCPSNLVRFIPSLGGYVYALRGDTLFVNLYAGNHAVIEWNGVSVTVSQVTEYPWRGNIQLTIDPATEMKASLALRIPGWAMNHPLPGNLYRYTDKADTLFNLAVNSLNTAYRWERGYAVITRKWNKGDFVDLVLQMPVRKIEAGEKVKADSGCLCLSRGPLVYCGEETDNPQLASLCLSREDIFVPEYRSDFLLPLWGLSGTAYRRNRAVPFRAIPYYAWGHRGCNAMKVWFNEKENRETAGKK